MRLRRTSGISAWAAVLALAILAAVSVSAATAAVPKYPTDLGLDSSKPITGSVAVVYGQVKSPKALCIEDRSVRFFGHFPDGHSKLLGSGTSSGRGYWVFTFNPLKLTGIDRLSIRVTRRNIGTKRAPRICLPVSVNLT